MVLKNNNWLDDKTGNNEMKTLGATELSLLRSFVKDVLNTCEYDDTGVSDDLYDKALACSEILGIVWTPMMTDPDLGPDEEFDDHYEGEDLE